MMFVTFDQIAFGTIGTFASCEPTKVESTALNLIATLRAPVTLSRTDVVGSRVSPMWSAALSCLPMVRLYATSSAVTGLPFDHFAFGTIEMLSVLPSFVNATLFASML